MSFNKTMTRICSIFSGIGTAYIICGGFDQPISGHRVFVATIASLVVAWITERLGVEHR